MKSNQLLHIGVTIIFYGALAAGIILLAGTPRLPFFWAVLAVQLLTGIIGILTLDPDLLSERMRPRGKDKDPLGPAVLTILFLLHLGLGALDAGRWHLTDSVPFALQAFALVFCAAGWGALLWSMVVNKFFSSAIRLQPDRGQLVIEAGPYQFIRHPGYAFASVGFLTEGLVLGSWLSELPVLLIVFYLIYRTILEEQLLRKELAGYEEYSQRVRFRWIPGLW